MDKTKPDQPIKVTSEKPAPDTESWYQYMLKAKQDAPNRLEDAAKFLATMISLSLTLFLAICGGNAELVKHANFSAIKIALVIWIGALVVSFFVLFPWRYRYIENSAQSIQTTHQRIVRVKRILLFISLVLFLAALFITGCLIL
jgi:membrane protein YdbS with pleckstrin-like domain